MKSHQGHKIITLNDLNQKTKKIAKVAKEIQEKEKMQLEVQSSLEAQNKTQKRKLDEVIDQEIFHLSMLKKKLYKEIDIQTISDKDRHKHMLL